MMPNLDTARVRVLLEQLCALEPAWFWRTENGSRIDAQGEFGAVSVARIHANSKATIYVEPIRNALEALHDARGWNVTMYTGMFGNGRWSRCEIVTPRKARHVSPTRLEAMLEATVKALGGAV